MSEISVRDLCALALEPNELVEVWSSTLCADVYLGTFRDIMWSNKFYARATVESFSCENGCLVINIE